MLQAVCSAARLPQYFSRRHYQNRGSLFTLQPERRDESALDLIRSIEWLHAGSIRFEVAREVLPRVREIDAEAADITAATAGPGLE